MKAEIDEAIDGRRLVHVVFSRQSADSKALSIEVVYQLYEPSDFTLDGQPYVLLPISCTRTDTREAATLSPEETALTMETAVGRAATANDGW